MTDRARQALGGRTHSSRVVSLTLSLITAGSASSAQTASQSGSVTVHDRPFKTIVRTFNQRGGTVLTGGLRV